MGHVKWPKRDQQQATVLTLPATFLGHKVEFLVDSGAERSIIPSNLVPDALLFPSSICLTGVTGSKIQSFGQCFVKIGVKKLRREFPVTFIAATAKPILGADFLTQFGLLLDMKSQTIYDPLTSLTASLVSLSSNGHTIHASDSSNKQTFLSVNFPSVLLPPDYTSLPSTDVSHQINTEGPPLFSKPRPLSPIKLDIAKREFDHLLKLNIVQPSSSPWASPLHMVKKSDGSWRPCGDYRRVNSVTIPDRYPVPNIQHFHNRLRGSTIFSKVDLVKAYHFVPVDKQDIPKTAICTPFGSFEYLRMPFGLRNSSGTFQRFIDCQLRSFSFTCAYLDDILIFSKNPEEHTDHLKIVLTKLSDLGLKVNESKCEFNKESLEFLGYNINEHGIRAPDSRIESLVNLSEPKNEKELVSILGMFGFYQKCMPQFANIVLPLRNIRKSKNFSWNKEHSEAFMKLKDALASAVRLSFPSKHGTLTITADASSVAIGACLNQTIDGEIQPLSFWSRKLSDAEQRLSTFDRELLAIFAAVRKWRDIIDGFNATVFTDHKPIVGAFKNSKPRLSDKQQRQLSFIGEYISDIIHIAGKDNVVADTLSRSISSVGEEEGTNQSGDLMSIAQEQAKNSHDYDDYKAFDIGKVKLFCETSYPNPRPVVPVPLRQTIFQAMHNLCHPGTKATLRLLNSRYFWKNMKPDVQKWCAECLECQAVKIGRHTKKGIKDLPCPSQRFSHVHMDIVGPLEQPEIDNPNKPRYLLPIIDSHTRWMEAAPLNDITSTTICHNFFLFWVSRFGPPLVLTTDRGTQFCSELSERLNDVLGIHHIRTCAFNPRANGMVERVHRNLKCALKARGKHWLSQLPIVLLGIRMRPDENGESAFSRTTGEQPMMPHILPANADLTELSCLLYTSPSPRD